MVDFSAQILRTIHEHQMIKNGDTVIVALSGGGDSTALFHFFFYRRQHLGITLRAAHVNHGLRGADSDADETFVTQMCAAYHVPLDCIRLAPPENPGEAWGRQERYRFFDALAKKYSAKIATAHTRSDNAETVLFNLARGANVHGAAGIPPMRGAFIRPLLDISKADIEAYLSQNQLDFVTDATNFTNQYARNRVRHTVLPALETVHPGAENAIAKFAADMSELAAYLDAQAQQLLCKAQRKEPLHDAPSYTAKILASAPPAVRKAALRMLIAPWADPTAARICGADAAICAGTGAVQLSAAAIFSTAQGVARVISPGKSQNEWSYPLQEGAFTAPNGIIFTVLTKSYEEFIKFQKGEQNPLKNVVDCDKIQDTPLFRTRKAGDTFRPQGRGVTKTLKALFSEAKLSASTREMLPVLACGSTALWVAGFGFADGLSPDANTTKILAIAMQTEEII